MIDRKLTFALAGLLVNAGCGGGSSSPTTPTAVATPTPAPTCAASQISIVNARFDPTQRVCSLGDTTTRVNYDVVFDLVNTSDLALSITSATLASTCVPGGFSTCQNNQITFTSQSITPTTASARGTTTVRLGFYYQCSSSVNNSPGYFEWQGTVSLSTSCGSPGASVANSYRLAYQ